MKSMSVDESHTSDFGFFQLTLMISSVGTTPSFKRSKIAVMSFCTSAVIALPSSLCRPLISATERPAEELDAAVAVGMVGF